MEIPLTDRQLSLPVAAKFIQHAIIREKMLKIVQYATRLAGYLLRKWSLDIRGFNAAHFFDLNKRLSTARRFFKLLRWLKHFGDIPDAMNDPHPGVRRLLCADIACNFVADIAEDITSLDKLGIIPKGMLPKRTEYYANWCQMVLAVAEIIVAHIKERRLAAKTREEPEKKLLRKHELQKLEVCKYWCDLVKAFYDCELSFATEISFIFSGLLAAIFSTHKQMIKCLG
eukprot:GEMP01065839.1.p1 GENE.GEMP01065839.1~~GEMP01065839.1.p1  ORF type:complete len:228 (+),score=51.02 GEMP01065839.1:160-843(+)